MNRKRLWKIVFLAALAGCILCLSFVGVYLYQDYQAQKEYEALQESVALREKAEEEERLAREEKERLEREEAERAELEALENGKFTGESDGEEPQLPDGIFLDMDNPIDFKELQAVNEDIYAWIRIPDTKVDYPIAQREGDDSFYLRRDIYKKSKVAGTIYTEDCNSKDFTDPNTLIYGHNMRNGSMFKGIHKYEDAEFFENQPYVYIYTPDRVRVYEVFASYVYDDRHIMNSFDFTDEEVFQKYLDNIFAKKSMYKNLREDVEVTAEDRIITLSTCVGGKPDSRYLVHAVLIKDEESVQGEAKEPGTVGNIQGNRGSEQGNEQE